MHIWQVRTMPTPFRMWFHRPVVCWLALCMTQCLHAASRQLHAWHIQLKAVASVHRRSAVGQACHVRLPLPPDCCCPGTGPPVHSSSPRHCAESLGWRSGLLRALTRAEPCQSWRTGRGSGGPSQAGHTTWAREACHDCSARLGAPAAGDDRSLELQQEAWVSACYCQHLGARYSSSLQDLAAQCTYQEHADLESARRHGHTLCLAAEAALVC